MSCVIEAQEVSFRYGSELILEKISFCIEKGEFVAIIGSNGAGKSTLLRLLLGELTPFEGSIRLFDREVHQFSQWPRIGFVPQHGLQPAVGFPATALEIVQANLFSQIGLFRFPKPEHRARALDALRLVGMEADAGHLIGDLSGGQQQRVMLAQVLAGRPELMLLDEPTTGVDSKTVQLLFDLLARLNRETGLTIVMVTHDVARVSDYASRTLCLEEGSIVELNRPQLHEELSHKHTHPRRRTGES